MNTETGLADQPWGGGGKEEKGKEKVVNSCFLHVFPPAADMRSFEFWHSFE